MKLIFLGTRGYINSSNARHRRHAGWVLASAGILKGRKATCYLSIKDDIVNAGAEYRDAEVVRDGNLISSRQPSDLGAFCREIITALAKEEGR